MPAISHDKLTNVHQKLFSWLGTFWTKVYTDPKFISHVQFGRSLRVAQLYLDLLENLKLCDRNNAPIFHRERWYPLIIRKSEKNTGNIGKLGIGTSHANIGPQTEEDSPYGEGTVLKIGVNAEFKDIETYPIHGRADDVMTCIVDSIIEPKVILRKGVDFVFADDSIGIIADYSPFLVDSPFPKFDLVDSHIEGTDATDQEVVLWSCNAMTDYQYLNEHLGYAMGATVKSTEAGKAILNRSWDLLNNATPANMAEVLSVLCNVPCVKEDGEVVEQILEDAVITDKNVYRFDYVPSLRNDIIIGQRLVKGTFLDDAIKVYPFITDVDKVIDEFCSLYAKDGETAEDVFRNDFPILTIPANISNRGAETAGWDEMEDDDFAKMYGMHVPGGGTIVPIRFFLENVVGANTLFVILDGAKVGTSDIHDTQYFDLLKRCIPAYIRLDIMEKAAPIEEIYDGKTTSETPRITENLDYGAAYDIDESYSKISETVSLKYVPCARF